jgi:hypothetical protein
MLHQYITKDITVICSCGMWLTQYVQYVVLRSCDTRNVNYARNPWNGLTTRACSQEIHTPSYFR